MNQASQQAHPPRKTLDELSRSLKPQEREELLNKIRGSLDYVATEAENLFEAEEENQEKNLKKVQSELDHLVFWRRLLMRIKSFFLGKSPEEIYIQKKLHGLRKGIENQAHPVMDFYQNEATPALADAFYSLYSASMPLYRIIDTAWRDHSFMLDALNYLLGQQLSAVKTGLEDVMTFDEMVDIYSDSTDKADLRKAVLKRLNDYLKAIPAEPFQQLENVVLPFLYLKYLVLFPYKSFFSFFKVSVTDLEPGDYPPFQRCSIKVIVDFLEKMEYAFHLLGETDWSSENFEAPLRCYLMSEENLEQERLEKRVEELMRDLESLGSAVEDFQKKINLPELVKAATGDPYYSMIYFYPRINIRNFYQAAMKIRLLSSLDEKTAVIKREMVRRSMESLFEGYELADLVYYRPNRPGENLPMAMPAFQHTESIKLLHNFCTWYYQHKLQRVLTIITSQLISKNQLMQGKILQAAGDLQEVESEIRKMDRSLAPESDTGKNYHRLRYSAGSSTVQMQQYRTVILETDRDAETILEKGDEILERSQRLMKSVLASPAESVQVQLRSASNRVDSKKNLAQIIREQIDELRHFQSMLRQVSEMEKGD